MSAVPTSWPTGKRALRDERSFASVAEEHLDDVYRYLLYMTGNPHLAEDLAAETFERALRRWRRFDPRRRAPLVPGSASSPAGRRSTTSGPIAGGASARALYASDVPEIDEPVFGEGLSPALDRRRSQPVSGRARSRRSTCRAGAGRRDGRAGARDQADRGLDKAEPGPAEARGEDAERCPTLVRDRSEPIARGRTSGPRELREQVHALRPVKSPNPAV